VTAAGPGSTLLVIAYHFPPGNATGAARPYRFYRYLSDSGYRVSVVAEGKPAEGGLDGVRYVSIQDCPAGALGRRMRRAAALQRWLMPYDDHLSWVPAAVDAALEMIGRARPAAILSTAPPLASSLVGLELKKRTGLPWIADFRDPLAGNAFRQRYWAQLVDPLFETGIFSRADLIIANNERVHQRWRRYHPRWKSKYRVLYNGFDPEERAPLCEPFESGRREIVHLGTLYGRRHPALLVQSMFRLIRAGKLAAGSVCVRLVGSIEEGSRALCGPAYRELQQAGALVEEGLVSRQEAHERTRTAGSLLLLELGDNNTGLHIPAKLFEYVCAGRPILCFTVRGSAAEEILQQCGVPNQILYEDSTEAEIDQAVLEFFGLPRTPQPPSEWFETHFNGVTQCRALAGMIQEVAS
jgi:glycosyltransferase involved in cell wall biosynthesis